MFFPIGPIAFGHATGVIRHIAIIATLRRFGHPVFNDLCTFGYGGCIFELILFRNGIFRKFKCKSALVFLLSDTGPCTIFPVIIPAVFVLKNLYVSFEHRTRCLNAVFDLCSCQIHTQRIVDGDRPLHDVVCFVVISLALFDFFIEILPDLA